MNLGRNERLHLSCAYVGRENDCPKECSKCAISIKTDGDVALASNRFDEAIKQYKKALFITPGFAEAWNNLANALAMKQEYNNALTAFNKALAIDPQYGKAMYGKAITLRNLGKHDSAMALANDILELYDNPDVRSFKSALKKAGARDSAGVYTLQKAIDTMTDKAYEIIAANNLLEKNGQLYTIREIDRKEEFAKSVCSYCKKRYNTLGDEKVWSESILTAFYGSLFVAIKYYQNPKDFYNTDPFAFLCNHVNLEEIERSAEKELGIRGDDNQSEKVWNIVYSFVTFSIPIIEGVEPVPDRDAAVRDAAESAYVMGMLMAMRHHEQKEIKDSRSSLDKALDELAASSKDYTPPPKESAMCYSIALPREVPLYFRCDGCGRNTSISVRDDHGEEQHIAEDYRKIAQEFTKLGYPAVVKCYCNQCANRFHPSNNKYRVNNFVFSLLRPDCDKPIDSFPSSFSFVDLPYRITLAFLKGADTINKLSEATGTKLEASAYMERVHEVLGNHSEKLGGTN